MSSGSDLRADDNFTSRLPDSLWCCVAKIVIVKVIVINVRGMTTRMRYG